MYYFIHNTEEEEFTILCPSSTQSSWSGEWCRNPADVDGDTNNYHNDTLNGDGAFTIKEWLSETIIGEASRIIAKGPTPTAVILEVKTQHPELFI